MTERTTESRLLETFATLADTLVAGYDVVDLLQTLVDACRDLLGVTAAGILLADGAGSLELVVSTSEAGRLVELMQLAAQAGPCIECYRTGATVSVSSIAESSHRWPAFAGASEQMGFHSALAVPMRLRETTIGTLNLLRAETGEPAPMEQVAARAFADVATIGILHERSLRESEVLSEQPQVALNSRVLIEQAKGVVSFTAGVAVEDAFALIRGFARARRLPLSAVAAQLVSGELRLENPS